jgi:hypothetical protein
MRSAIRSRLRPQGHAASPADDAYPALGEVIFEIGVMLTIHLAVAVAVSALLQTLGTG